MTKTAAKTQAPPQSQRPWWLTLVIGIAAVVVGGILLFGSLTNQLRAYLLLVQLLGIWWLVDGIMNIVQLFTDRHQWGWKLLLGIVSIIAGAWILIYPVYAGLALPSIFVLMLGIWGVVEGVTLFVMAFKGGGGAHAILGIFAIFFGLILIAAYTVPGAGLMFVWVAAIGAFLGGFFVIYRALKQRQAL
jgi:uncharacterized membrane protein HdeD (DUF308 family)